MNPPLAAADQEKFEIRLGEALNKAGLLTPAQLAQAMWEKADNPLMLGELCMQHGWVAPQDLYPFIPVELVRIGEILVLHGYLELEHVYQALLQQKHHPERKLGQILVQQGWVQPHWLEWALDKQQQLRRRRGAANSWEVMLEQWSTIPDQPPLYASPLQVAQQVHKATAQYQAQLERYQEQVAALEAQLERERQQLVESQSRQQQQQQRIAELEAQLAAQIQQGSEQHRAAQQRIQELEEQLRAQQDRGSAQVQALAEQLQAAQAELETLRRHCHELTEWQSQALEHKEAELAALSQSLQEQQHQLQVAQSTKARLIADLAHARQEASQTIHRLRGELQEAQTQLQVTQERLQEVQAQLQATQSHLQSTEAQLQQAREQVRQLQAQVQANRTPSPAPATQTASVAESTADAELPPQEYLGEEDLEALQRANPWVRRILTQLRAAGLLDNAGIETVLHAWETEGGTFTDVLTHHSGLKPETVKFFSEDGYSVYLAGGRHVADYLKASGLVSAAQIQQIQEHLPPGGSLCQALVEAGILSQATALYFERHFGGKKPRRSLRQELML
jgi:peptidoglycan hydrolase CwlO-like protein